MGIAMPDGTPDRRPMNGRGGARAVRYPASERGLFLIYGDVFLDIPISGGYNGSRIRSGGFIDMINDEIKEEVAFDVEGNFPGVEVKYVNVSFDGDDAYANYLIADRGSGEETVDFHGPVNDLGRIREAVGEWLAE